MEVLERYAKVMPVFGFMQVGAEYFPTADQYQTDIGRKMIDLGSEFVIGNSPHWVQNSEVYKDKLIVYSTGNFIFDQLDAETNRGLNMDVTFKTSYDANMAKWLELGPSCAKRSDDCLDQAEKAGLKKIKLRYDFAPVASAGGYKQLTRKGDAALQAGVEQRLDWAKTLSQLKSSASR
jgi:poly-gamma-glutamate capsule biosynthesis protein CapA/YwtB (metallophosphatase superfamily)